MPPDLVELTADASAATVTSAFVLNPCQEPVRLEVAETATAVQVRTVIKQDSGDCTDLGVPTSLVASLEEPLGERRLVAIE